MVSAIQALGAGVLLAALLPLLPPHDVSSSPPAANAAIAREMRWRFFIELFMFYGPPGMGQAGPKDIAASIEGRLRFVQSRIDRRKAARGSAAGPPCGCPAGAGR
ncbi:MAG: hypothetical protein KIS72_08020, partial [Luteimonas sp.]|nr:hypothetical protein [Luteimonas sp.]